MKKPGFEFELIHTDRNSGARLGKLRTPRGIIELPAFMPVGTCGTVKGLTMAQVRSTGAQIILGNTYHLALRPGAELVAQLGGLPTFSGWNGPMLTDSGGFQLFSLAKLTKITESGARFQSHIDGSTMDLSPERSVEIQEQLGADIAMVLDHVIALPASQAEVEDANERTSRWAKRCKEAHSLESQVQFAIVQGGLDPKMRKSSAEQLVDLDFDGYAIGGLSVGEPPAEMYAAIDVTCPYLPFDRPRYLMGVGTPQDLLEAIRRGVDMFDCVMPTRNGRNAMAFTDQGKVKMRNLIHRDDPGPLDPGTKTEFSNLSRAYLRHLFVSKEMLGPIILSLHNIAYYQRLMREVRDAIAADSFLDLYEDKMRGWGFR